MATTTKAPPRGAASKAQAGAPGTQDSTGRLKGEVQNLLGAFRDRAIGAAREKAGETIGRLTDYAEGTGGPGLMAAVTGAKGLAEGKSPARAMAGAGWSGLKGKLGGLFGGKGKGKGGQGKKLKVTNIVETIDVGVPVRVAYNQWTQFRDYSGFMKKVENVEQESDEKLHWRAQVFWSHRNWKSTIMKQVPDQEIIWRSDGDKGYVDGAVTFHEIAPNLTRIVLVLEYNPKGLFERTGNLWRAQGRRARLELKHFRRHVMTQTILHPEEIEGWRGVIEDGEVVKDHETAVREEGDEAGAREGAQAPEDEAPGDEAPGDEAPGDELREEDVPEDEAHGSYEDDVPEDEARGSYEEDVPEDEARGSYEDDVPEDEGRGSYEDDEAMQEDNGQRPTRARRGGGQRRTQGSRSPATRGSRRSA